jgi:hypothetical protein
MKRFLGTLLAAGFVFSLASAVRADDKDATAILDKAIKAIGGADKLGKVEAVSWKAKGKIKFGDNENQFNTQMISQDLDHLRSEFEGEFNGNAVKGLLVMNGDKGWRKFNENVMELDEDALANEKRNVYLQLIPAVLVQLKGKGFKMESASEQQIDGKPAVGIKVTGPDKKDFTLYFDKDSGLLVKAVARVMGFGGEEFNQETTYANYKDFGGIKKATKLEVKRDGETFVTQEVTEFKVLDKPGADTFAEPK